MKRTRRTILTATIAAMLLTGASALAAANTNDETPTSPLEELLLQENPGMELSDLGTMTVHTAEGPVTTEVTGHEIVAYLESGPFGDVLEEEPMDPGLSLLGAQPASHGTGDFIGIGNQTLAGATGFENCIHVGLFAVSSSLGVEVTPAPEDVATEPVCDANLVNPPPTKTYQSIQVDGLGAALLKSALASLWLPHNGAGDVGAGGGISEGYSTATFTGNALFHQASFGNLGLAVLVGQTGTLQLAP